MLIQVRSKMENTLSMIAEVHTLITDRHSGLCCRTSCVTLCTPDSVQSGLNKIITCCMATLTFRTLHTSQSSKCAAGLIALLTATSPTSQCTMPLSSILSTNATYVFLSARMRVAACRSTAQSTSRTMRFNHKTCTANSDRPCTPRCIMWHSTFGLRNLRVLNRIFRFSSHSRWQKSLLGGQNYAVLKNLSAFM